MCWPGHVEADRLLVSWGVHEIIDFLVAPDFLEARIAMAAPAVRVVAIRVLHVEVLVVVFCGEEGCGVEDDRAYVGVKSCLNFITRRFSSFALTVRCEDGGAIGVASVAELTADVERIHVPPEEVQEVFIADHRRIENDLNGFVVPGTSACHIVVGRVLKAASGKPGNDANNSVAPLKRRLGAPETTHRKNSGIGISNRDCARGVVSGREGGVRPCAAQGCEREHRHDGHARDEESRHEQALMIGAFGKRIGVVLCFVERCVPR